MQTAQRAYERLAGSTREERIFAVNLGAFFANMGRLMEERKKPEAALEWYARSVAALEGPMKQTPPKTDALDYLRNTFWYRADCLIDLGRYADALADWDRAAALDAGPQRRWLRARRAYTLAHLGDHAQATREAQELAAEKAVPVDQLYDLARVFALSAKAALRDQTLDEPGRANYGAHYAARAVELLRRARKAGFKAAPLLDALKKTSDFEALRSGPEFKNLLSDLEHEATAEGSPERR
jgi:tetratricopeptide (TPR) repeat protein